ncbi:MAG: hypothetical protein KC931_22955, partial [Candidatus Omnitrophica bacterium]|nr:hypothetical protein [Candidatus Omnitrophota bacterium]
PIFLVGTLGLFFAPRGQRRVVSLLAFVFLLQSWIIAAYLPGFHGGAGFGNRLYDHALPLCALGLAAIRRQLSARGSNWERGFVAVVGLLIVWNFLFLCMILHAPFNDYQAYGLIEVATQAWGAFALKFLYHFRVHNLMANLLYGIYFREVGWLLFGIAGALVLGCLSLFFYRIANRSFRNGLSRRIKWIAAAGFLGYWFVMVASIAIGDRHTSLVHALELAPANLVDTGGLSYRRYRLNRHRSTFQGGLGEVRLSEGNPILQMPVFPEQSIHSLIVPSHLEIDPASPRNRLKPGTEIGRVTLLSSGEEVLLQSIQAGIDTGYSDISGQGVPLRVWKNNDWDWPTYRNYARQWMWEEKRKIDAVRIELLPPYPTWVVEGIAFDLEPPSPSWKEFPPTPPSDRSLPWPSDLISDRFFPVDLSAVAHSDWGLDPTLVGLTQPAHVPMHTLKPGWIGASEVPIRILPEYTQSGRYSTLTTC